MLMRYNNWCENKPMKATMISTGIITFTGDIITQYFMFRLQQNDKRLKAKENKDKDKVEEEEEEKF